MFLPAGPSTGHEQEIRRTARILDLIQRIAVRPHQWKRNALAADFEISERQVQKDLDIVRHRLRLPLQHDRQGYYFTRIPQLPAVTYSFSEALALLLAVQSARQVSGIASAELAAAVVGGETSHSLPFLRGVLLPYLALVRRE